MTTVVLENVQYCGYTLELTGNSEQHGPQSGEIGESNHHFIQPFVTFDPVLGEITIIFTL